MGEFLDDDDRAVSPVIGVVLMVALTVVLAAVITTAAMAWGESFEPGATASVTVEDGSEVTITQLGPDTDRVICVSPDGSETASGDVVGQTLDCDPGDNVVAVGSANAGNRTIRTGV